MKIINGMEFINDHKVIGKWKRLGKCNDLDKINDLNKDSGGYEFLFFLPNGQGYWIFEGWTKGYIVFHYGGDEPLLTYKYELKEIDNKRYMIIYIDDYLEVLEQSDNISYKLEDIGRHDNINLIFIDDENAIGRWNSVGFVSKIEDFKPEDNNEELWLKYIEFMPNGKITQQYMDEEKWNDSWTKGFVINMHRKTTAKYLIQQIKGQDYMFLEWKMGNYIYGGQEPEYYVFKRG